MHTRFSLPLLDLARPRPRYEEAQLTAADVDFFGLYDCFPICFLRAVEAAHLAPRGEGGRWVEEKSAARSRGADAGAVRISDLTTT